MAMTKRVLSVILTVVMLLSVVQIGATAVEISAGDTAGANKAMVDDGTGREVIPTATVTVSDVVRVAAATGSMAKGTAIVSATPSGVPAITSTYATEAYAGETPSFPTVTFTTDLSLANNKNVTIACKNNTTIKTTVTNPNNNTWIWTITGGTAAAGSYLDFEIGYSYTYTDSLTGKEVTNSYVAYASAYVEGIIQPAGLYINSYRTRPATHSGTNADYVYRILGKNTYGSYYDGIPGATDAATSFEEDETCWSHGYFDFVSMTEKNWSQTAAAAAGYGTVLWGVDNGDGARYGNTGADFQRPVSTTYIDSSKGTALNGANINLRYTAMDLCYGDHDDEYNRWLTSETKVLPGEDSWSSDSIDNTTASNQLAFAAMGQNVEFRTYNATINPHAYRLSNYGISVPFNGTTYTNALTTREDGTKEVAYTLITHLHSRYEASERMIENITAVNIRLVVYNKLDLRGLVADALTYYVPTDPLGTKIGVMPQARYYSAGWDAFKTALTNAQRVLAKPNVSQGDIDAAYTALETAQAGLVLAEADYSTVDRSINELASLNADYYTPESWARVVAARNAVVEGYTEFYQCAVDKMGTDLAEAIRQLEYTDADFTYVDEAVAHAGTVNRSVYTDASLAALDKLVTEAQSAEFRAKNVTEQDYIDDLGDKIYAAIEDLAYRTADYTEVNKAVERYRAINTSLYTEASYATVTAIYESIVWNLNITMQSEVDAMASDLNDAIDTRLKYKPADYSEVDAAIAQFEALDPDLYTDESYLRVEDAVYAVEEGLNITQQETVDAYADAIFAAIKLLERTIGDYSKVAEAIEKAEALNPDHYTPDSWQNLQNAINSVEYGLKADKQTQIDGYAIAIEAAITALVPGPADYTAVEQAIARYEGLNTSVYTTASLLKVRNAINKVVYDLDITQQETVDGYAAAINTAIDTLVYKTASYTAVNSAKTNAQTYIDIATDYAAANKGHSYYTEDSYQALQDAIAAVVEGLPITEQSTVDGFATAINDAVGALQINDAYYGGVEAAKAKAPVATTLYTEDSVARVTAAINAVDYTLKADEQATVNAYEAAITDAIKNLAYKPINTAQYESVKATIPADTSVYTAASVKNVTDARTNVETFLAGNVNITHQTQLNTLVNALKNAITNLAYKPIDTTGYEAVDATLPADLSGYTDTSVQAVTDAKAAIVSFLAGNVNITHQAQLDTLVATYDAKIKELEVKQVAYFRANADSTCVIDGDYIYGLQTRLTKNALTGTYLDFEGVEVEVNAATTGRFIGTGSTVVVTYPDGAVETYTIIVYGDMDGNGSVDNSDISGVKSYLSTGSAITAAQKKAMNLDLDRRNTVTITDLSILKSVLSSGSTINQVDPTA